MQKVQVKKWGNSHGIRIPRNILDSLDLGADALLEIKADPKTNSIILKVDESLTPYQKLMLKRKRKADREPFVWDRLEEENPLEGEL